MKVALIGIDLLIFVLILGVGGTSYLLWSGELDGVDMQSLIISFSGGVVPLAVLASLRGTVKRGEIWAALIVFFIILAVGGFYLYGFMVEGFPRKAMPYLGPTGVVLSVVGLAWWLLMERDDGA
jgi:hypothetical protein